MTDVGTQHIDEITQDIACPQCEYNLRGLHGAVVNCPECGLSCDIAKIVATKWNKPWWKAPGYTVLQMPAVMMVAIFVLWFLVINFGMFMRSMQAWHLLMIYPAWTMALIGSLAWVYYKFRSWIWVGYSVLMLLIVVVYLFAFFTFIGGLVSAIDLFSQGNPPQAILQIVICVLSVAALVLARRGEKWIARRCIKRYLDQKLIPQPPVTAP